MKNDRPQSEIFRDAADKWADLDAAARMLEDTKTAVFAQRCVKFEGADARSQAQAEMAVKSSDFWAKYLKSMVDARTQANKAKIEMEFRKMQAWERNSQEAYERAEMRMGGTA